MSNRFDLSESDLASFFGNAPSISVKEVEGFAVSGM